MASEEHKLLSQFIKDVHASLRKSTSKVGAEKAWREHCVNKPMLRTYAQYMEKLATTHWEKNCSSETSDATSRIKWTADLCYDYFIDKSYLRFREKDIDISKKIHITLNVEETFSECIKLCDVGSCYNPFKVYNYLDVFAIDLTPANESVLQCDFLNVIIGPQMVIENTKVTQLHACSFDVVTFCFLLEYIPTSELRISACEKAYNILKPGGLLVINTPDSKHVGANCKQIKCWQYTLALIGFARIKYEKYKHMHCMAFRRSLHKNIAVRWAELHKAPYMEYAMHIPQDFNNVSDTSICSASDETMKISLNTEDFLELPFFDV